MRKYPFYLTLALMAMCLPSCVDTFGTRNNAYLQDQTPRYGHGGRYSPNQQGRQPRQGRSNPNVAGNQPQPSGGYRGPGAPSNPPPDGGSVTEVPKKNDTAPLTDPTPPSTTGGNTQGGGTVANKPNTGGGTRKPSGSGGGGYPYGVPIPGKKGMVYSPYAKDQGYVDVRDIKPGTKVTDPYTGKIFLVP